MINSDDLLNGLLAWGTDERRIAREEEEQRQDHFAALAWDAFQAECFEDLQREKDEVYQAVRYAAKISQSEAEQLSGASFDISLDNLEELPPEIARNLSKCKGILRLNGLKSLSDDAAKELGQHLGGLELDGLTDISEQSLLALISHPQPYCSYSREFGVVSLSLQGLTDFPVSLCKIAAKHRCVIVLGMKEISFETAIGFSEIHDYISLPNLEKISPVAALACILHDKVGSPLDLEKISLSETIDCPESVATLCATFGDRLEDLSLHELSDVFASELSKYKHTITIGGVDFRMSPLAALTLLARGKVRTWNTLHPWDLAEVAGRLTSITEESAFIAARVQDSLALNNITELSTEAAAALSLSRGDLKLNGLRNLSDEAAFELTRHTGQLELLGLEFASPTAAVALLAHGAVSTSLDLVKIAGNLEEVTVQTARVITQGKQIHPLKGLRTVSKEVAEVIVEYSGENILLTGVFEISSEAAEVLAKHSGLLSLGLECLPPSVASALSGHRSILHLDNLTELSYESAVELFRHPGEIHLGGIAELREDIALKLVGCQAVIGLPSLKKVTPTAALALLAHGSVITPFDLNAIAASLPELTPELAKIMVDRYGSLHLDCLTKVSEPAARVLAGHMWELYLNGVTELSEGAALALVRHPGKIYLKGLKSVSPVAADALRRKGNVVTSFW